MTRWKNRQTADQRKARNRKNYFERSLREKYPHRPECTIDVGVVECVCGATEMRIAARREQKERAA